MIDPMTIVIALGAATLGAVLASLVLRRAQGGIQAAAGALAARERAADAVEKVLAEREAALAGRTKTCDERERMGSERERAGVELERAQAERERGQEARGRALDAREQALAAREGMHGERERAVGGREETVGARERAQREADAALVQRTGGIDAREVRVHEREQAAAAAAAAVAEKMREAEARERAAAATLEAVAGLDQAQARAQVLAAAEATIGAELSARIAKSEKEYQARAKEMGIEIVSRAIQRYAAEHTADTTVTKIKLPDEEMKGRIIGKEGRNIKAFELATGVDVIIDETPQVIGLSCFDPVRREIARRTLAALIEDGRIQPARIEEVLAQVQAEIDQELVRRGEDAAFAVEVSGLHPQVVKLLGKLHFRTSYGQNVLKHTQEVAFLCGAMAADLGLDPRLGRRCGLLHDIGKAIDHEQEGSHPELGHAALKRYGESEIVANAALAHHEGHAVLSAYTVLAAAADAISAARPGARSENAERYIKRLQQLEAIACDHPGVQKAYAIQAGRELRVIVNGHTLADQDLPRVAREIARRIEGEVQFPGEIKVTLIREVRGTAVAR
jgi:ribonuclease Y